MIFFFQAEGGIRDTSVTGVQTCALPISADGNISINSPLDRTLMVEIPSTEAVAMKGMDPENEYSPPLLLGCTPGAVRSEERRVGKEWRSRRSAYKERRNDKIKN